MLGPHVPSPLGRLLRLPAVPFSALADPPFAVLRDADAAQALVAAARVGLAEPVNVVAPEAITAWQAILRGRRLPLPLFGTNLVCQSHNSLYFSKLASNFTATARMTAWPSSEPANFSKSCDDFKAKDSTPLKSDLKRGNNLPMSSLSFSVYLHSVVL